MGALHIIREDAAGSLLERLRGTAAIRCMIQLGAGVRNDGSGLKVTRFQVVQERMSELLEEGRRILLVFPSYGWASKYMYSTKRWLELRGKEIPQMRIESNHVFIEGEEHGRDNGV